MTHQTVGHAPTGDQDGPRITARRAELDELEERPAKQLAEVRAELEPLRGRLVGLVDRGRPTGVPPAAVGTV
ncbi:hypothetical protein [Streptomyces sp. NPDC050804]|uniref:hypothetical protein n=1 Tax=Streptomyces sp. NPDC050804 TaxID=3154745 RepID=UPI003430498B